MATPERKLPFHEIHQEQPISYSFFRRDYTMLLLPVLFGIGVLVIYVSGKVHAAVAGYFFIVVEVFLTYVLIYKPTGARQPSVLATQSRKVTKMAEGIAGRNNHLSDLSDGSPVKPRRKNVIKKLGRVDITGYQLKSGLMGVAHDRLYGTYAAPFECQFSSFLVDDVDTLASRLEGWATLLDRLAMSGSRINRVSFRDQTLYREPVNAAQVLDSIRKGAGLSKTGPNQAVLLRHLEELGEASVFHRTTMTVSIDASRQKEAASRLEGGMEELLATELYSFLSLALGTESGFSPIGLKSAQVLTRNNLVLENRLALDPVYGQPLWQRWKEASNDAVLLDESIATPDNANFHPDDHCKVGRTIHRGFYLNEPDQKGVLPDHFWNILRVPIPKIVTAIFYGVPPRKAQRGAELRRGSARGRNAELLSMGRQIKSTHEVEEEKARSHEDQVARNQGAVGRVRCFIDLTAPSLEELSTSTLRLDNAMWDTKFTLGSLDGRQHLAPSVAMPLARGLALPSSMVLGWIDM